jgi:L-fuconolactonase
LRIVIDHIAHTPVDGEPLAAAWVDRYQRLAECPQIHIKVSALMEQSTVQPAPADVDFYRPVLDALWKAFGPDRLIYGSNWPVCERAGDDVDAGLHIIKTYLDEKGQTASAKVLWKNAQTVYRWVER